jgi:MoxR-like ATPase
MTWSPYYRGDGVARDVVLSDPPPWRTFPRASQHAQFQPPDGLAEAVNAALHVRRPLLITGPAGSGKSTVIEQVSSELKLGDVLRWHITSRSSLADALYRYDALGRIHAHSLRFGAPHRAGPKRRRDAETDDIGPFLQLGPLGTALLPNERPRALLIDEIDKSDLDLPSDLLEVLERGEYEIPELVRYARRTVPIRQWDSGVHSEITDGRVRCTNFPFIVMTSNDESDFPPAFLRRCIRYTMPKPTPEILRELVRAHLGAEAAADKEAERLINRFLQRVDGGDQVAIDQLLNAVLVLTGPRPPEGAHRAQVMDLLMRELSRA